MLGAEGSALMAEDSALGVDPSPAEADALAEDEGVLEVPPPQETSIKALRHKGKNVFFIFICWSFSFFERRNFTERIKSYKKNLCLSQSKGLVDRSSHPLCEAEGMEFLPNVPCYCRFFNPLPTH